ncbi:uncharacterized protein LOC113451365 [Pseudonaja textilis]|uniref:Uncharacterized LOC113451365 n=1 Tax=Pseudonaja textilis TaxID=8673 RepID=A0A670ZJR1_PSETE|nr:uncharacterized protein LOC113451365 [Pseudonaja textilis]XP_026578534.1 uncharacterized protein LOC113451365 [Pseudonaja textilis]XP_026578535.1 uncharacterized protein LOC113451365 [Pseudonaja textilis]XP_026578536.1 uncharacterized protein LOC113451365 [Pseudonaja textilis]
MGRPRKTSDSAASPRPAAKAPKAGPGAPRSLATSRTVPATSAKPTATVPKSGSGRGTAPEKASYSRKPRGAGESAQPRPATASDGRRGGPRKSDGGAVKSPAASGGVNPPATSDAASKAQGKAKGLPPAPLSSEKVAEVERETRGQWRNPEWHKWRENRITASIAPRISNSKFVNGRTSEVPQSYLKEVVRSGSKVHTPAMNWGIRNEKKAVQAYEALKSSTAKKPVKVKDCGLFVDKDKPWLAGSPDGIVQDANTGKDLRLLEVKCPYKHRNKTVAEACRDNTFCLEKEGSSYSLKKTHPYYTQVQCQMGVSGLDKTDFVVHTNKETAIAPVDFDPVFWKQTVPKLEKFYTDAVVPYLEEKNLSAVWANEE